MTHQGGIYNNQLNDYGGYYKDEDNEDTTAKGAEGGAGRIRWGGWHVKDWGTLDIVVIK